MHTHAHMHTHCSTHAHSTSGGGGYHPRVQKAWLASLAEFHGRLISCSNVSASARLRPWKTARLSDGVAAVVFAARSDLDAEALEVLVEEGDR
eukprot:scaffold19114_cov118-Isochrysis_galbana.AAC.5